MLRRIIVAAIAIAATALVFAEVALAADAVQTTSNAQKWNLVVGFAAPLAIAAIKRHRWSEQTQALATFVIALAAAAGTAYWQSTLSWENWTTSALEILTVAIASYYGLWKPTGVAGKIDRATG